MELSKETPVVPGKINKIDKLVANNYKGKTYYSCDNPYLFCRDSFIRIYFDMKSIIKNGSKYQKCFLVYGNDSIGKTTFSCFLAYCFNIDRDFKEYNIVFIYDSEQNRKFGSFREAYGVKYTELEHLPDTSKKTIVICDNMVIREDDYSNDEIVIMVSSPNANKYKIMSNKRAPVQYYLLPLTEEEADYCKNKLSEREYKIDDTTFNKDKDGLPSYIPPSYNENFYIYNTDEVSNIPNKLKFKSQEIERIILITYFNSKDKLLQLYNLFKEKRDGIIFERIYHIIFSKSTIEKLPDINKLICIPPGDICYHCNMNQFVEYLKPGEKYYGIDTKNEIYKVNTLYIDFSEIHSFPAIDGCIINKFNITSVQMTISDHHPIKDTVIVFLNMIYDRHKDVMINYILNSPPTNSPPANSNPANSPPSNSNPSNPPGYPQEFIRESSLYELGYIPINYKKDILFKMDMRKRILCESYFLINELIYRRDIESDLISIYSPERLKEFLNVMKGDMNKFTKLKEELNPKDKDISSELNLEIEKRINIYKRQLTEFENILKEKEKESKNNDSNLLKQIITETPMKRVNIEDNPQKNIEPVKTYKLIIKLQLLNNLVERIKSQLKGSLKSTRNVSYKDSIKKIMKLMEELKINNKISKAIKIFEKQWNLLQKEPDKLGKQVEELQDQIAVLKEIVQQIGNQLQDLLNQLTLTSSIPEINNLPSILNIISTELTKSHASIKELEKNPKELVELCYKIQFLKINIYTIQKLLQSYFQFQSENDLQWLLPCLTNFLRNPYDLFSVPTAQSIEYDEIKIHNGLVSLNYQLQLLGLFNLEEANELVKNKMNCNLQYSENHKRLLHDLDDYLVDCVYLDDDNDKENMMKEIVKKIKEELGEIYNDDGSIKNINLKEKLEAELKLCNPIFKIVIVAYEHDKVIHPTVVGDAGYGQYGELKTVMINEMEKTYNWDIQPPSINDNEPPKKKPKVDKKDETDKDAEDDIVIKPENIIISIKSKRLRIYVLKITSKVLFDMSVYEPQAITRYTAGRTLTYTPKGYSNLLIKEPMKNIINHKENIIFLKQKLNNIIIHPNTTDNLLKLINSDQRNGVERACRKIYENISLDVRRNKVRHLKSFIGNTLPTKHYVDKLLSFLPYDQTKHYIDEKLQSELYFPINKENKMKLLYDLARANKEKYDQLESEFPHYFIKEEIEIFVSRFRDNTNNDYIDELLTELPIQTTEDDVITLLSELHININKETIKRELSKLTKYFNEDTTNRLISELLVAKHEDNIKSFISIPFYPNKDYLSLLLSITLVNISKDYIKQFLDELLDDSAQEGVNKLLSELKITISKDSRYAFLSELSIPNEDDLLKLLLDLPFTDDISDQDFDNLLLEFPIPINADNNRILKNLKYRRNYDFYSIKSFSKKLLNDVKTEYNDKLNIALNAMNEIKKDFEEYYKPCSKTNGLCQIFERQVVINDDNTISIGCDVYQYPEKRVYIRNVYREIWNELKYLILFVKFKKLLNQKKKESTNLIIKILNDLIEEEGNQIPKIREYDGDIDDENDRINYLKGVMDNIFKKKLFEEGRKLDITKVFKVLLRGNPGCGKTSFIIFLLKMIIELNKRIEEKKNGMNDDIIEMIESEESMNNTTGLKIEASIFKNGGNNYFNKYQLKEEKVNETDDTDDDDIAISDSYNLRANFAYGSMILYITSPDNKNYKHFYDLDINQIYYFMDVFSNDEIEEWGKKCLPIELQKSIYKNEYNKRYGNVPRHIYYAAIYDVSYGKDYWNDLYTIGIKRIIGGLGYMEFLMRYLFPSESQTDKISGNRSTTFDSTLCHYIVKYSIPYKQQMTTKCYNRINEDQMEFISEDVFDFIFYSIKHKAEEDDVEKIQEIFGSIFNEKDHQLFQLLFEELVFYNCLYHADKFTLVTENEEIDENQFEEFRILFNVDIYSTKKKKVYLLHLATLKNREMIYLMNNCFIHIINDERIKGHDDAVRECDNIIDECIIQLSMKMKWLNFHYIYVSSKGKTTQQSTEEKNFISHFNRVIDPITNEPITTVEELGNTTVFREKGNTVETLEGKINLRYYSSEFQQKVYGENFGEKIIQPTPTPTPTPQENMQIKRKNCDSKNDIQQPQSKKQYQPIGNN